MPIQHRAALAGVLIVVVACGPIGEDQPHTSSTHRAITATKWLSCWVRPGMETDPAFRVDTVECTAGIAAAGPLPVQTVAVALTSKSDPASKVDSARLSTGDATVVGRFPPAQFPLELRATVLFGAHEGLAEIESAFDVTAELAPDRTAERPLVLDQPFDIWPVTFQVNTPWFYGGIKEYQIPLAPFTMHAAGDVVDTIKVQRRIAIHPHGKRFDMFFLVPRNARPRLGGYVTMTREAQTGDDVHAIEIDGPGVFAVEANGVVRASGGEGSTGQSLDSCPQDFSDDGVCDPCLGDDPDCRVNGIAGCEAQWFHDGICDSCLGNDPDCGGGTCPASWRGDGVCDACLGDDPDCAADATCPASWYDDGVCDPCLGDDPDCEASSACPVQWYDDGACDECLGDDPDCVNDCPVEWYSDGTCDPCLGDDPDCE